MGAPHGSLAERFWRKVVKTEGCWLWTGYRNKKGYGAIGGATERGGKMKCAFAHRVSWELHNGPIPAGLFVLHRCNVPACQNPAHLYLGTKADNNAQCHAEGRYSHVPRVWGENNNRAKLTSARTDELRARYANGESQSALARAFGIHHATVHTVVTGRTWKHRPLIPRTKTPYARGEEHPAARVTAEQVAWMRERYAEGGITQQQLALLLGVSKSIVQRIVTGRSWRHLPVAL